MKFLLLLGVFYWNFANVAFPIYELFDRYIWPFPSCRDSLGCLIILLVSGMVHATILLILMWTVPTAFFWGTNSLSMRIRGKEFWNEM